MRLKSVHIRATNQRIRKRTCAAVNIFMLLCLLSNDVWCSANIKHQRPVGHVSAKRAANYEDFATMNSYHQPHFTGNRSVIVQLFEWKFVDIAAECRDFLGPQGYAGVQLSPVLEHTVVKTAELNHPWWERYEVISYRLASRSGDESEFWSMSRICNEHGVRIYADVLLNHMAAPLNFIGATAADNNNDFLVNTLLETDVNISQQSYAKVPYTRLDFHQPSCEVRDSVHDAHEIRNCQLNGHPDLDHSRGNVQKQIVEMLNKLVGMGVAGFRIDAAKYMWPIDLKNILREVKNLSTEFNFKKNSRPFFYHDVFDLGSNTVSKTEYSTYGVVSEYLYPAELSTVLRGKVALSSLINWGPAMGFLPHEDALVFIDSHDTQRGLPSNLGHNQMLTYKQRIKYIMANVFMLVHPYGAIKRIMSSYYFPETNINQGPPAEEGDTDEIRSPQYNKQKLCTRESGWVCEHRWPELLSMIKVANYFKQPGNKEESVIYFQTNGANQVAFCRGYKAFVAINNDPEMDFVKEVYACLEPGMYCDMVTGGKKEGKEECQGKMLEINDQGYIQLELSVADENQGSDVEGIEVESGEEESGQIASYGIIVIYAGSKIKPGIDENAQEAVETGNENNGDIESSEKREENEDAEANESQSKENSPEGDDNTESADDQKEQEEEGEAQEDIKIEPPEENESQQNTEVLNNEAESEDLEEQEGEAEAEEETKIEASEENDNEQEEGEGEDDLENSAEVVNNEGVTDASASAESTLEDTDRDGIQAKENENEENIDDDEGNVEEETDIEQTEQNEEEEEAIEEENSSAAATKESAEINPSKEEDKENEKPEEDAKEGEEPPSSDEEIKEEENENNEEIEQNIENADEENNEESEETPQEAEAQPNDVPIVEEVEGEQEDVAKEPEEAAESPSGGGINQSRNLDDRKIEAEAQIEKPSAEVVDEIDDVSEGVTAKIQDIQTAGFSSNSKGNETNG